MVDDQSTGLAQAITSLLSDEWISDQAGKLTVIKRQRKIDPVVLVWTLALGFTAGANRAIASRFLNNLIQVIIIIFPIVMCNYEGAFTLLNEI